MYSKFHQLENTVPKTSITHPHTDTHKYTHTHQHTHTQTHTCIKLELFSIKEQTFPTNTIFSKS
jgi:hypothetical protein